jgi:hypothetical protein
LNAQGFGDFQQRVDGNRPFGSFHLAYINGVKVCHFSEFLLAEAGFLAAQSDIVANQATVFWRPNHSPTQNQKTALQIHKLPALDYILRFCLFLASTKHTKELRQDSRSLWKIAFAREVKNCMNILKQPRSLCLLSANVVLALAAGTANGQTVPRPGITIAPTGANLLITVTNGVSYGNYTLYATSVLNSSNYPWLFVTNPVPGVTNFTVSTAPYFYNFFQVTGGTNWNQGGVPNWDLADPKNPSLGALTVTIVNPTNGSTIQ